MVKWNRMAFWDVDALMPFTMTRQFGDKQFFFLNNFFLRVCVYILSDITLLRVTLGVI